MKISFPSLHCEVKAFMWSGLFGLDKRDEVEGNPQSENGAFQSLWYGEKTTSVYGAMWVEGWDKKINVFMYRSSALSLLPPMCDLVEFYHASRLINLWIETSIRYFTQETNLSIKLWTAEKSSVYNESVFSTMWRSNSGCSWQRGKLGLSTSSCPAEVSFQYSTNESHVPQKFFLTITSAFL